MLQSYPQESICVMWCGRLVCCEVFVCSIGEVCSQVVVCAVYVWLDTASLFVGGWSPVWTGDTWMGHLASQTDVLKCACVLCAMATVVVTRLEVRILCN